MEVKNDLGMAVPQFNPIAKGVVVVAYYPTLPY